jgi:hypothetical protein
MHAGGTRWLNGGAASTSSLQLGINVSRPGLFNLRNLFFRAKRMVSAVYIFSGPLGVSFFFSKFVLICQYPVLRILDVYPGYRI